MCGDTRRTPFQTVDMPDDRVPNNLRAWRESKRMTQEKLAEAIGSSKAVIGHLESGERRLSHKWLVKIAPIFGITPGRLLDHKPDDIDQDDILEAARAVPKDRLVEATAMLRIIGGKR